MLRQFAEGQYGTSEFPRGDCGIPLKKHREELPNRLLAGYPRWFQPWAHLIIPALVGLGLILAAVLRLRDLSVWQLLWVPAGVVLLNACEWTTHRNLMHYRRWIFYDQHTPEYHAAFVNGDMAIRSIREFPLVLIPAYAVLSLFAGTLLLAGTLALLDQWNIGLLCGATTAGYVLAYEWLHLTYHLPPASFLGQGRMLGFLRRHHATHHALKLMQ